MERSRKAFIVIAGVSLLAIVVLAAYVMSGGPSTGPEIIRFVSVEVVDAAEGQCSVQINVTRAWYGGSVAIAKATLKNQIGDTLEVYVFDPAVVVGVGTVKEIPLDFTVALNSGSYYIISLETERGNWFTGPTFQA